MLTLYRRSGAACCLLVAALLPALGGALRQAQGAPRSSRAAPARALAELYAHRGSLPATLLATRALYRAWRQAQPTARKAVTLGPWHAAAPAAVSPGQAVDLAAKDAGGKPLWTQHAAWKDGSVIPLPGRRAVLARTLAARQPVTLTVGLGGGDRLTVRLNGRQVASADTHLPYLRYGTSMRVDGTRRDQALVNLRLPAGQGQLVVQVEQSSGGPFQFWFSPSPDPQPRLWEQVREDFPAARHRLLAAVRYDWFGSGGWLARADVSLERRLLERLLGEAGPAAGVFRRQLDVLARQPVPADDPRWLELCDRAAEVTGALADAARLRAAVEELAAAFPDRYPGQAFLRRLDAFERRVAAMASDPLEAAAREGLASLRDVRREMLVRENPLLKGARLLFVRRHTYDSAHYYDDYYNGVRGMAGFGGNLCELSLDAGTVRELVAELAGGLFDRYDLSFDATRVVFGYRRPKPEGSRIWETGLDGKGLRQLTFPPEDEPARIARYSLYPAAALKSNPQLYGHWTDDMHPCYLPDGGIAFVSSRCERGVLCGGHSLTTTCLYRIDAAPSTGLRAGGSDIQELSQGALSEFTPALLADGRILYNRWEYVYKGIAAIQPLWTMRPDGSGSEAIYGDNVANPGVLVQARQVPGRPDLVVCTGCGHEPLAVGTIVLLQLKGDRRTAAPMVRLTPDTDVRGLRGLYQRRNGQWRAHDVYGPFYCDPYPLSDTFFLVACNPDRRYNDTSAYGIYLLDTFGNLVEVYDDPEFSCWQPTVLRPRPRPPVLPPAPDPPGEATLLVTDVYQGLDGVPRGTVKHLRVMEQVPRPWSVWPHPGDDRWPGQMVAISYYTHIWVAVIHGIVPVHDDGSAYFTVPAGKSIYFQALDESFMEVQKMRTFVNFQPGERRSCIGCHEHRSQAPEPRDALALRQPPAKPAAQPGEAAPRPLDYATDVQPIFDRHCVRCHSGKEPKGKLDLSGELTSHFCRSYEQLITKGLVCFIQEWTGPRMTDPPEYFTVGGSMAHAPAVPPYTYGSHKSKLIARLRKGHSKMTLSRDEWVRLVTWVDCNVPYYGSYFGRRHIRHKGRPDFRPVPTLASACGIRPEPEKPTPVAATLVAWWPLDEGKGKQVADASRNGHTGKVVGVTWTQGKRGGALAFDGKGYVEVEGLGDFETVSVALWVKADALTNTWSPLLFTWDFKPRDFHFSLLRDGAPNVAVNSSGSHLHRHGHASAGDGAWHHVAVVYDARPGGWVRFYVDGRLCGDLMADAGTTLDLDRFRLGAYNGWQGNPGNNFHGALDDVRVYRGMLTDPEVASLASPR